MDNPNKVRAMVLWGHAPNSQTRGKEMKTAMEALDMLVVVDPYPTVSAVMQDRTDGVYLLPACTQFETRGSVTASNRSLQWREKVVEPLFESMPDDTIIAKFANKFGFADRLFRNIEMDDAETPNVEEHHPRVQSRHVDHRLYRAVARADEAAHGQPAHLRSHHAARQWRAGRWRDLRSALALLGHARDEASGHAYPLRHVQARQRGGLTFRARFGVERDGDNLLAEGVYSAGLRYPGRLSGIHHADADGSGLGRRADRRGARP